jgi:ergothioneine biosynthesis protein EgtB
MAYADWIDEQVRAFLVKEKEKFSPEIFRLFMMGINHEYQHQELLVYDVQHLLQDRYEPKELSGSKKLAVNHKYGDMIKIPGGIFELGYDPNWQQPFYYDIEAPLHRVYLNDFMIDRYPVTNGAYLEFIEAGGYNEFRYWLSDGWDVIRKNGWQAPLYWEQDGSGEWGRTDFRGRKAIRDLRDEPVTHISYYEAWAYARWAGKRLPTEAEWEKAAAWDEDSGRKRIFPWGDALPEAVHANLFEGNRWAPSPIGAYPGGKSYYEVEQLVGDMWEWTTSEFMPYPGFKSGFAEYNDKWFGNQKVLRGGSFATSRHQIRNTYRNFFRCPERWLISGFRCVSDC